MRETKFRAWIYDNLNKSGAMYYAKDFGGSEAKLFSYFENKCVEGEDFLMQYIGRKDKNSKEAYGGDRVIYPNDYSEPPETNNDIGVIYYNNEKAAFYIRTDDKYAREQIDMSLEQVIDEYGDIEIIGNIHQNPKLMEKQK